MATDPTRPTPMRAPTRHPLAALAVLAALLPNALPAQPLLRLAAPEPAPAARTLELTAELEGAKAGALLARLDGVEVARAAGARLNAALALAWPSRPQRLEVEARDAAGCPVALELRFLRHRARDFPVELRLAGERCDESGPWARVFARAPAGHAIRAVRLFAGARLLGAAPAAPAAFRLSGRDLAEPFLRAEVTLDDGRAAEATQLLAERGYGARLEVRRGERRLALGAGAARAARARGRAAFVARFRGVAQRIVAVEVGRSAPLELGVAVDASMSTLPFREEALALVEAAGRELATPGGSEFVLLFSSRAQLLEPGPDGRLDPRAADALPLERTALFDALAAALAEFAPEGRRAALFAVTDGCDTASGASPADVIELARTRGIPIYALLFDASPCQKAVLGPGGEPLTYDPEPGWGASRQALARIAEASGGALARVAGRADLSRVWRQALADLERQAVVVYEPSGPEVIAAEVEVEPVARGRD